MFNPRPRSRLWLLPIVLAATALVCAADTNSSSIASERFRRLIPYMTYYITQQTVAARPQASPVPAGFYRPVAQFSGNSLYKPVAPPPPPSAPTASTAAPYPHSTGDVRLNALVRILAILQNAKDDPNAAANTGIQALAQILSILQQTNALPVGTEAGVAAALQPHLPLRPAPTTVAPPVVHHFTALSPRPFTLATPHPTATPAPLVATDNNLHEYDEDYDSGDEIDQPPPDRYAAKVPNGFKQHSYYGGITSTQSFPDPHTEGSTPGRAGIDYPNYSSIPQTGFSCKTQRYKGFFGDPETSCQVWHYCDLNGGQASFLCPNGTIFSQVALTCDWWFNVRCASTPQLYVLNERLYKYIIPVTPSFPEDFHGPLVDQYIALKFQEQEKKKQSKLKTTTSKPKTE